KFSAHCSCCWSRASVKSLQVALCAAEQPAFPVTIPPQESATPPENCCVRALKFVFARTYGKNALRAAVQLPVSSRMKSLPPDGHPHARRDAVAAVGTLDESIAREQGAERFTQPRERDVHRVAVAERMVLGSAPHFEVQILEAHSGRPGTRKLLEDLQPLRWERQLGAVRTHPAGVD